MQDSGEGDIEDIGYGRLGVHGRPLFSFPAPPQPDIAVPLPRCSLMLRERREAQVVVEWALLGSGGAKRGDIQVGCCRSGMGEEDFEGLMCIVLINLVFMNIF